MKSLKTVIVATALATGLVGGGFAIGRANQTLAAPADVHENGSPALSGAQRMSLPSFADLAARVSPTVVNIKVTSVEKAAFPDQSFGEDFPFPGFGFPVPQPPQQFKRQGAGSGFIIRKDGVILTNNHVVENAQQITVTLADKKQYKAKVLGRDPKTDLAVIKIDPKSDLPAAALGSSDALRVGDWVMAIGNPFGFSNTVTTGIVSAKGRTIGAGPYDSFIQTDAPINPGNSGGPLFNLAGEVVGINSAIYSQSGGNIGIGFAIPIDWAKSDLKDILEHGRIVKPYLGLMYVMLTPAIAKHYGLSSEHGAIVVRDHRPGATAVLADSPAQKAGLKEHDIITKVDGTEMGDKSDLMDMLQEHKVGEKVSLTFMRSGKEHDCDVTLEERK